MFQGRTSRPPRASTTGVIPDSSCSGHGLAATQIISSGLGNAFQAARLSCGPAVCISHDGEPGGSEREHDAWRQSLSSAPAEESALRP
jgi:hypothetical protein